MTERPERITCRADAVQLWKHLLSKGISFHWEDEPWEWTDASGRRCLRGEDVTATRDLMHQVEFLGDQQCYRDAVSLLRLALILGADVVAAVPPERAGDFELIASVDDARGLLARA